MFEYIKEFIKNIINIFLRFIELNKKYKLKLVLMLSVVTFGFLFIIYKLILIDQINTSGLDVFIDNNSLFYYIGKNKILNGLFKIFFGGWNFSSPIETLLISIILGFIFIVSLVVLSYYIKLFMIPLTMTVGFMFYNIIKIIKNDYNIENLEPIFSKWGIILTKKVPSPLSSKDVLSLFDSLYSKYNDLLLSEHKYIYKLYMSKEEMQSLCLKQNFTDLDSLGIFINTMLQENMEIRDIWYYSDYLFYITIDVMIGSIFIIGILGCLYYFFYINENNLIEILKEQNNISKMNTNLIANVEKEVNNKLDIYLETKLIPCLENQEEVNKKLILLNNITMENQVMCVELQKRLNQFINDNDQLHELSDFNDLSIETQKYILLKMKEFIKNYENS